jgi:hypothetical protein
MLDAEAVKNMRRNEFTVDESWSGLGGYNKEKVYPLVEYLFWNDWMAELV